MCQHGKVVVEGGSHQVWVSGPGKDVSRESGSQMIPSHDPDSEICRVGCS